MRIEESYLKFRRKSEDTYIDRDSRWCGPDDGVVVLEFGGLPQCSYRIVIITVEI